MLETGKTCISCGRKRYLNDFILSSQSCSSCSQEAKEDDDSKQQELKDNIDNPQKNISHCKCGRYFIRLRISKKGKLRIFQKCPLCR